MAFSGVSVFCIRRTDRVWYRKCDTGQYDHDSGQFGFAELSFAWEDQVPTSNLIIGIVIAVLVGMILLGGTNESEE